MPTARESELRRALQPRELKEYHVFVASPGDMDAERQTVHEFFAAYNRHTAARWNTIFTVIDWKNCSTIGVGEPQKLITRQTLERYKGSLALVIGIMGQRFGQATRTHESGTQEEFEWTLESHAETGFPEIKWFFRDIQTFQSPSDPDAITNAAEQWKKVREFRQRLQTASPQVYYAKFSDAKPFAEVLANDLMYWLNAPERPWWSGEQVQPATTPAQDRFRDDYHKWIIGEFESLDIAGIDVDRAVDIPLEKVYVRLRVIRDEDDESAEDDFDLDSGPIDIHTALGACDRLVIVGDPGSGKSTFLKFIALMLARTRIQADPGLAAAELNLYPPLPVPIFISLWDLADFIKRSGKPGGDTTILDFLVEELSAHGVELSQGDLEAGLGEGAFCLLFDGLDEVPTEDGRAMISRLVEKFVGRFYKNRFVVTSRVRGYTGDAILKSGFIRCDIQDFNESDRQEFLNNWFAALFAVRPEQVLAGGGKPHDAYTSLRKAIERKDRIRALAVNPLLMTVIAIVHWNRKRLPDQRVDLYDECIAVLLGQRRSAERARRRGGAETLDEFAEDEQQDDRQWVRKRFAEIALQVLRTRGDDEITRDRVVDLLRPRFRDRGAQSDECAEADARRFIERQELRSGLLVSRRAQTCRFVHLAFQEYLAAWNLANQRFDDITSDIDTHIRSPRWFETLQLLGGELAKRSDEDLDRYVGYLLDRAGDTIGRQAPVIALCANVLRDVGGVADITPGTRTAYNAALEGTLRAFDEDSRIPVRTQLEVLEGLGQLGDAVKEHLINATKARNCRVRSRALHILVPHLPDNDLFAMDHILNDRSYQPILTYLTALFDRDPQRAAGFLIAQETFVAKAARAVSRLLGRPEFSLEDVVELGLRCLPRLPYTVPAFTEALLSSPPSPDARKRTLCNISRMKNWRFRYNAFKNIIPHLGREEDVVAFCRERATEDEAYFVRLQAFVALGHMLFAPKSTEAKLLARLQVYFWDINEPWTLDSAWVAKRAETLGMSENELWEHLKRMAEVLPIKLKR